MDFKNVPKKYRPIPFWSWNEKLDTNETKNQIHIMEQAGMGGFFMHARGGLKTEYMGDEWFENVDVSKNTAKEFGMYAWAYDENGWPSGFGNGKVNGLGEKYQQKYLRMSETKPEKNIIAKNGSHWFFYEVNPFYVDLLDKNVVRAFIETSYKPYYEKYGNEIEGFFTDEPLISRCGIPWSFVFEDAYSARYGLNLTEHLEELLLPVGNYKQTRINFWKMVTDLFSESYVKQIYDQCNEWGLKLTGHLVCEDSLMSQLTSNGACMPHYEYMHIPGMDLLCRDVSECLTQKQLSSVAEQFGKEFVLTESFALCGHNVSFSELKGIYEWQTVRGINLLCQHLEGYSIRGIRKRDYPPAMYYQQPWWSEYRAFNDYVSREGMILSQGKKSADVLLIHPQTTAWTKYSDEFGFESPESVGSESYRALEKLDADLLSVMKTLEEKHIEYHFGDETIMERHATVENGKLNIGCQSYSYIITSCCEVFLPTTEKLLSDFEKSGGKIITAEELTANTITDNPEITYTKRTFDGFDVHFFVNTSPDRKCANFTAGNKKIDLYTGELSDFCGHHEFEPWGSLMLIDDGSTASVCVPSEPTLIHPSGEFVLSSPAENTFTLDYCDYYFDGELQEKNGYVLNICERANALHRPVKIHIDYHVRADFIPENLRLVCETPEIFDISVNGRRIDKTVCGYFRDKSFKTINIAEYMNTGENTISFDCDFVQSDEFYSNLEKSYIFESEKNKLAYDIEIEPVYLIGEFGVKTDGVWSELPRNSFRYDGDFSIVPQNSSINVKNIEQQGFPFFCGELCIEGEIDITGENPVLELDMRGVNAVRVEINGITKVMLTDNRLPLADFGVFGKTAVKFTLINNLRNLLGPHHLSEGESYIVAPESFFNEPCVWAPDIKPEDRVRGYCFVETGI